LLYGIDARRVVEIGVSRGETALTVLQNNEYIEEYIGIDVDDHPTAGELLNPISAWVVTLQIELLRIF
jgi:hypothetical protein